MANKDTSGFAKAIAWIQGAKPEQIASIKAVEPADLDNLVQIYTSLDNGGVETVPSAGEILTGAPVAARGSDASEQIARHAELAAQEGRMKKYEELDGRLSGLEKAVGVLVNLLKKANEDEIKANKDEDEDVSKSLRKARIALRKAESGDDDEWEENMEKAEAALKSLNDIISKAEDEAESDEDEKKTEKARADLSALKSRLKIAKSAKTAPATVTKSEDDKVAEAKKAEDAWLATFAASKGITVAEMLSRISSDGAAHTPNTPPTFSKSAGSNVGNFIARADTMRAQGVISENDHMRLQSVFGQIGAMNANLLAEQVVQNSISQLSPKLREVFNPASV